MDRSLLARATEGTEAPTPGYLYVDLAKSAASNPSACQDMAVYLTRRLQSKNNPNIKFKCCKVIAKLSDQVPRNQFRRCLAQDPQAVAAIKEAMNFRGTMDPVLGDEPNKKVRIAAKEALDAIYREAPSSEMGPPASMGGAAFAVGGPHSSYGPSPYAATGGGYSGGGGYGGMGGGGGYGAPGGGPRRMEGIGNPRYNDPRLAGHSGNTASTFKESIREAGEVVLGMIKDPLAKNVETAVPRQGHSGNLPGYGPSYGQPPPGAAELSRQTGGQWTMASNRGPGAVQPPPNYERDSKYYQARDGAGANSFDWAQKGSSGVTAGEGTVGGSWAQVVPTQPSAQVNYGTPSITIHSAPVAVPISGPTGGVVQDGSYEKNLVMELCPPGGLKPVPPTDKLATFSRSLPSLNADLICPVLLDLLEDGQPWIIRAKALCVMETCVRVGARADGTNPYMTFFHTCHEEIAPLAQHPRAAIHEPARRLLELLGVSAREAMPTAVPPAAAPPVAPAPNLLDFGQDTANDPPGPPPTQAPPPPPQAQEPTAAPNAPSLFGGMQIKGTGSSTQPAAANSSAQPQRVANNNNDANLLDFDAPTASSSAAPDVFAPTAAPPADSNPPDSLFGDMSIKDSSAPQEDKKTDDDGTAEPAGGGSAFGFINESAAKNNPSSASAAAPNQGASDAMTPDAFDPLKNSTPSTAQKKMLQFSPEQMQAMAYQQMMMQQQMQQMQLAMAMQKKVGGKVAMPPMYPNLGGPMARVPSGGSAPNAFTFRDTRPAKKDDKKFDFVKDAMQTSMKK